MNLSMSMNSRAGRTSGSSVARLATIAEPVEEQLAVGQPREAVVHGVVHQPLLRALGVRHLAHEPDAAQVAAVGGGHGSGLELEPAVGVVGVAHAELDAQLAVGAILHGGEQQLEALAVGGVHVLGEVVDLGRQLAGLETQDGLHDRADLDLVAALVPFPHAGAGAVDGERSAAAARRAARRRAARIERNAYCVTVKPISTTISTSPAVSPNTTMSPDRRPVKVMPAPNSHTSSSIQVGTSDSARSWPRMARNSVRRAPRPWR